MSIRFSFLKTGVIRVETAEERLQKVLDEYEKIEVLIIDEASNMDNKTASMLFACLPNIKLLFLVFDNGQIAPIGPGQLAFDILKFFEKNRLFIGELKENMRVNRDPQAQQILVNDQLLMAGKVKEMVFNPLPGKGSFWDLFFSVVYLLKLFPFRKLLGSWGLPGRLSQPTHSAITNWTFIFTLPPRYRPIQSDYPHESRANPCQRNSG